MKLDNARIALTGATGFLGGYLVETLLSRRAHVIAVVRNPAKAAALARRGVEVRRADLGEPDALCAGFAGADAVISNAAVVSFAQPRATHRTNVEGTRNVFDAIVRAGVKRAVAISSASAYPPSWQRRDEQAPLRSRERPTLLTAYGRSKATSERIAWELSARHGVQLTAFRPCGITGLGDPLLLNVLQMLMRFPVAPFPVFTRLGVVHAGDVAEAVALALEQPAVSAGKAYNLQGENVSLWALGNAWKKAGGPASHLRIPIPWPLLMRFDDSRARRELGWKPRSVEHICEEAVRNRGPATVC